eukprot:TRINITY_DN9668_c0_g1_i4.p2 TRINITY_DN9668_c0_g1~~TRINITY_DN9668_c0_g1_i4.p2  ORF type:complete len:151 (-),score=24.46 TRINITY_DN9668_c0_g1_i4:166-618(-)
MLVPERVSHLHRLRPLAVHLYFVVGHGEFAGIAMALFFTVFLSERAHCDHTCLAVTCSCSVLLLGGFLCSVVWVCVRVMPRVVDQACLLCCGAHRVPGCSEGGVGPSEVPLAAIGLQETKLHPLGWQFVAFVGASCAHPETRRRLLGDVS